MVDIDLGVQGFWSAASQVVLQRYCQSGESKQSVKGRAAICLGLELVVDEGVGVEGEGMEGL